MGYEKVLAVRIVCPGDPRRNYLIQVQCAHSGWITHRLATNIHKSVEKAHEMEDYFIDQGIGYCI